MWVVHGKFCQESDKNSCKKGASKDSQTFEKPKSRKDHFIYSFNFFPLNRTELLANFKEVVRFNYQ